MFKAVTLSFVFFYSTISFSQSISKGALNFNAGLFLGGGFKEAFSITLDEIVDEDFENLVPISNSLVLSGGLDYSLTDKLSIGLMGAFSSAAMSIENTNNAVMERVDYNRLYFAARLLKYYGNYEKLKFYSGLRIGYMNFNITKNQIFLITSQERTKTLAQSIEDASGFSFGLTPIGMRYYFSSDFAIFLETSLFSPSFFGAGFCYQINRYSSGL